MGSPLLSTCVVIAIAALVFSAWMHWAVVDPTNVGWLLDGEDRGQNAIGTAAYLRAGGPWPSLHQPLLGAPEGMTLLFTDSIPLIGLVFGPAARWLPQGVQYVGVWLLLCVLMQAAASWWLIYPRTRDRLQAALGTALLTAIPVLINRYGHPSLCAQWLILLALGLFLDPVRFRRAGWWATLLGVAALVHSYLLLICMAIWASALLRRLADGEGWRRVLPTAAGTAAVPLAILVWHGALAGGFVSTGTYGAFPVALDALWNPANPSYSALLPSSPDRHARGFEGLQYLGAGLLFLTVVAAIRLVRDPEARRPLAPLRWLLPAFLVLTIVAIGPLWVWRGHEHLAVELPQGIIDLLDPVRASGRLFWPVTYTIALVAIVTVAGMRRGLLLLAAALTLQIADLTPMFAAVRQTSAQADNRALYTRVRDSRWDQLIAQASSVEFQPAEPFVDLAVMEQVTWRAVLACRPVRFTYASRQGAATTARLARERRAFAAAALDPTRLYILLDGRAPASVKPQVRTLDGIAFIPPARRAAPSRCVSASSP